MLRFSAESVKLDLVPIYYRFDRVAIWWRFGHRVESGKADWPDPEPRTNSAMLSRGISLETLHCFETPVMSAVTTLPLSDIIGNAKCRRWRFCLALKRLGHSKFGAGRLPCMERDVWINVHRIRGSWSDTGIIVRILWCWYCIGTYTRCHRSQRFKHADSKEKTCGICQ